MGAAGEIGVPFGFAVLAEEVFDFALEEARAGFVDDVSGGRAETFGEAFDELGVEGVVFGAAEDGVAGGVGAFVAVEGVDAGGGGFR